ncbi:MAG: efflux RND transporter periplasmic adaptor subunit [Planctomycetia bacterium]
MATGSTTTSADALSKLKIRRDQTADRPSFIFRLFRGIVVLLILAAVGGGVIALGVGRGWIPDTDRLMEAVRQKPEVRVATVSLETGRSADATVVATGYLESRQQARIGARATGRIEAVLVEEGTRVLANDVLAILEHADLDASLAAMEAAAARCRSELQEQDVAIQRALQDFRRAEKSLAAKTMTAAEFDTEKYEYDAAVARRGSLEAALLLAEARVQEAKQLRENMFVRAPFAGTVISKDAELGESILPGGMGEASGRGSVVTIADLEHLEVDCDVKEDFISRVTQGQSAEVAVDAVPGKRYQGKVRKIIPMGDRARATVKVRVALVDADEKLFPEMSSTVYFLSAETKESTEQETSRVFCPNDAIQSAGSETFVWVVGSEDRLRRMVIQTGEKKEDRTEVLSGLQGGEKVVVSPSQEFREGMPVRAAQ